MIVPAETKVKVRTRVLMAQRGMCTAMVAMSGAQGPKTRRAADIALRQI
jgi:predicted secreted protein